MPHHPPEAITTEELKQVLNELCFAAAGCLKSKPSKINRSRLRLTLNRSLKALKAPLKESRTSRTAHPDPVAMVAQYVAQGGNWQDLIMAINNRARSGETKTLITSTKGKDYDRTENQATRSH